MAKVAQIRIRPGKIPMKLMHLVRLPVPVRKRETVVSALNCIAAATAVLEGRTDLRAYDLVSSDRYFSCVTSVFV